MSTKDTTIVIHIGLHKTGTSSIQKFLHVNQEALLEQGILYPEAGRRKEENGRQHKHHLFLAWSIVRRYAQKYNIELCDHWWTELRKEIESKSPRRVILSSEFFWWATDEEIQRIQSLTKDYAAEVTLYVRNPFDLAISLYKQGVKTGSISSDLTDHFMERLLLYDYESTACRWERVFGRKQVSVHIYEKEKCNLIRHFADTAGIRWSSGLAIPSRINVSPSDGVIHLIRWMNQLEQQFESPRLKRFIHRIRRNVLGGRKPGRWLAEIATKWVRKPIAADKQVETFRAMTKENTGRFLEQRISEEDRKYFAY